MGMTYETDGTTSSDTITLTILAAKFLKSLGNLVGCRSWLTARLVVRELNEILGELSEVVERGSNQPE